jgi:NitT/TauT family transport system permease protein
MIRKPLQARWAAVIGLASVIALLAAYTLLSHWQHRRNPDDTTIPSWGQLADGLQKVSEVSPKSGERWIAVDAQATAARLFWGLACGILGAVVLGLLMGCFAWIEALLAPPLSLLAKVPPTAALAVFFVLVGTETEMYVAMIAFGVLPVLAQSVYLAVRDVPDEMLYKAATLGASAPEMIWSIILPSVLPKLLDAIRLQIGPAVVYLIAAEMVVGDVGFGYRIRLQSRLLNMNIVYPYLAALAGFGYLMDSALSRLQRAACPWYDPRGG